MAYVKTTWVSTVTAVDAAPMNNLETQYDEALAEVFQVVNTEVFSGNSPNPIAWTDVDVSAVVGTKNALVVFRCYNPNGGVKYFGFRPNGEAEYSVLTVAMINFACCFCPAPDVGIALCHTDANGRVEWNYNQANQAGVTVDVIAYIPGA